MTEVRPPVMSRACVPLNEEIHGDDKITNYFLTAPKKDLKRN